MMVGNSRLTNRNVFQCYHNNVGYFKYREHCRYQHFNVSCQKNVCRDKECKCMKTSDCHHMKLSPSEKNSIYSLKSLMSPSEHVTIWKNYSLSYQYEHVTIWFVTKCILFIPVTILVWNSKMVTGMNSSYQASIWWHLSPYGGLVWKIFIPVTKKAFQMVTVWEVLP